MEPRGREKRPLVLKATPTMSPTLIGGVPVGDVAHATESGRDNEDKLDTPCLPLRIIPHKAVLP